MNIKLIMWAGAFLVSTSLAYVTLADISSNDSGATNSTITNPSGSVSNSSGVVTNPSGTQSGGAMVVGNSVSGIYTRQTIIDAQASLNAKGFPVAADGVSGTNFSNAIRDFQQRNGYLATGVLDEKTLKSLGVGSVR